MNNRIAILVLAAVAAAALPRASRADDAFTITTPFVSHALSSCGDFTMSDGVVDSQGSGSVVGSSGHIISNGNIKVSGGTVNGNATSGPGKTITTSGSGKITGTRSSAAAAYDCKPADLAALAATLQSSNDNAKIPLSGQGKNVLGGTTHLDFTLSGGDTLTLPAGTYYFNKFTVSGGSVITLGGAVRILATNSVSVSGGSFVNSNPYNLRFWGSGTQFTISGGGTLNAFVYAPSASATISAAHLIGSMMAQTITVSGSAHVTRLIDDVLPQITITSPANNSVVSDPSHVVVTGHVSDDTAVTVQVNGQPAAIAADGTYQATLNIAGAPSPVTITATATDAASNVATAKVSVITERPPTLSLTLPPPGSFVNTSVVNLSGGSGTSTTVTVNGIAATIANGVWSLQNFNLGAEGPHTLNIVGTNAGGSTPIAPTLTVDLTPPTIQATLTPAPNAAGWNNSAVTVSFTCSDALSGVDTCPAAATVVNDGAGQTVTRQATDKAGNVKSVTAIVNIDTQNPQIAITAPANNSVASDPSHVAVAGTVSDTSPVTVKVNGQPATVAADGTYQATIDLTGVASPATITAVATDAVNNTASASVSVITIPPPTLSLTLPPPGSFLNTSTVTLSGGSGTATSVTVNGTAATVANGIWTLQNFDLGAEGPHTLNIVGTNAGGSTPIAPTLTVDLTPPAIQALVTPAPNAAGWNNSAVTVSFTCSDALSGIATCPADVPLGTDGAGQNVTREAVDRAGNRTPVSVNVSIDTQKPAFTFTSPKNNDVLASPQVVVTGGSDDAVTATVNGVAATIDASAKTFTLPMALGEGANTITVTGADPAGNTGTATLTVSLDTRAPQLVVNPFAACTSATSLAVSGRAADDHLGTAVTLSLDPGGATATAPIAADGTWSATIATASEGKFVLTARTEDASGHASVVTLPVTVDRTKPAIVLNAGGAAFAGGTFKSAQAIDVRATDADPNVVVTATLNDAPYVSGTAVGDGSYTLKVEAHDCAGNSSSATVAFKVDSVPPVLVSINPAEGAKVSSLPQSVTGTVRDADLKSVTIEGSSIAATVSGTSFTFSSAPLSEGANTLNLILADEAGNSTPVAYHLNVKTTTPGVTITERGLPMVNGAVFNRPVTPVVTANEAGATVSANLDNAAYDPAGRVIDTEGSHTITATAADGYGHTTNPPASVTFTIDLHGPAVTIESPADQAVINAATTDVRGTATGGDVDHVTVNNLPATLAADGKFTAAAVPLEVGENLITATATDRAGNSGTKQIVVTRGTDQPGIVLTAPADRTYTNRPTTTVIGQLLTRGTGAKVTINDVEVPVDSAGTFRKDGQPLVEGWNDITAKIVGTTRSVTVKVFADLTPPTLTVLANGAPLEQGAHFATSPVITLQAADNNQDSLTTKLTIDGVAITGASPVLGDGGHAVTAVATDIGGNAARVDRTFSVGGSAGSGGGCTISALNPPDGSTVRDASLKLSGHAGGAASILVNGARAAMESGTFAAGVQLADKANRITIACADAGGNATTDPATTLTIYLYTSDPTISIDAPARGAALTANVVTVTGHVGESVVSGDVNGIAFTPANGAFSVPNVSLANGMNVITARGRDGVGRVGIATVDVVVKTKAPSITITSPLPATTTGAAAIDVSGLYANAEASSVHVGNAVVETRALTDTTGSFIARSVPLTSGTTTTITATAQNAAGQSATATVDVQNIAGPSISISLPADNTYFAADAVAPNVSGTIAADPGSTVQVNGVDGAVTGTSFSAPSVPFATNGPTNYIARVATPDNKQATDSIRVVKLGALTVTQTFPAANATGVDPGVAIVVLFSNPIDRNTTGGMTLADDAGNTVIGDKFVDSEAVTFAPQTPLVPGRHYTLTISTSLKDLGGNALASPYTLGFTTGTTAPAVKPLLSHGDITSCIQSDTLSGTASAAGVRVQLDLDGITTTTIAGNDRTFSFLISFAGQSGFHIARVREIGADGSLSPAETVCYRITCNAVAPHVVGATLDRGAKTLAVEFSTAMDAATLTASPTGTIQLHPSGAAAFTGTVALNSAGTIATVTYTADLSASQTLTVTTGAKTPAGAAITEFTTTFDAADQTPTGKGYIAGAIYDADTGRAIEGASVVITPGPITRVTASNGHYATQSLAEGAYTIEATASGYTKVWRQVVVPAGVGVVPIDIRLTRRAPAQSGGADLTLKHGGANALTTAIEVAVPAAALTPGTPIAATSLGGQSLAGLLPLGWSPLAAAEVSVNGSAASPAAPLAGAKLTFVIGTDIAAAVTAANQTLSVVQYDSQRDEWRTLVAVATIANGRVAADIVTAGNYALVFPDNTAVTNIAHPAPARGGTALQGVPNPCTNSPADCRMTATSFTFNPPTVAPTEKSVATLVATAAGTYPSGTAVQAYIDEQLNFADGSVRNDAPFATDLLVYRNLAGSAGQAVFGLSPTTAAASGTLRDGADHVRVVDYPGRVDRGALIGAEGGRVPVDDTMSIDIPAGATNDSIHATATPMLKSALDAFGTIPGFHVAGGFTLSMTRSTDVQVDLDGDGKPDVIPVQLLKAARGTFTITSFPTANQQVVIAEVIEKSPYGAPLLRLAATTTPSATAVAGARVFSTNDVDPTKLPVDGIVRDGRYLVLTADAPVAYAWGQVRVGAGGPLAAGAFVAAGNGSAFAPALGLTDIARTGGIFAVAVQAQPAGAFALRGRTVATGTGLPSVFSRAAAPDENINFGDLVVTPLPPTSVIIAPNDAQVSITGFHATATFDVDMDNASADGELLVNNLTTGTAVSGHSSAVGHVVTFTPSVALAAGSKYSITVLPTIRSASGAPFGQTQVAYFTTEPATPDNTHIDASLIHITLPVNGVSTVTGTAGALPVGDIALAVRRGKFFVRAYSAEVRNADGSFSLTIGNSVGDDVITMSDVIDLQVLDKLSRSPIAIIPLTPFVTPDGLGFVAPVGLAVTFRSKDGITVRVPAGAFDTPTMVRITPAAASAFADVPSVDTELSLIASVNLDFDGLANKPLDIDVPIPAGTTTTGHEFQLGRLGDSALGPRIEIDDLLRVDGNVFTTRGAGTTGQLRVAATSASHVAKPNEVLVASSRIGSISVTNGGSGYTSAPTVTFTGGGGSGATAVAVIDSVITAVTLTSGGSGYTTVPAVTFTGGGGSGATATATVNLTVTTVNVTNGGSGYTSAPTVSLNGGGGNGATATAVVNNGAVTAINVTSGGNGYSNAPSVTISGGGGSGAAATAVASGVVSAIHLTSGGSGYTSAPTISFTGGGGSGAAATAAVTNGGTVTAINLTAVGSGYTSVPTVTLSGGGGSGATAVAHLGANVRDYLLHLIKGGVYAVTDIHSGGSPLAWTFMDGLQANLDIFWSAFHSLYVSQLYLTAGHGRVVMPVISDQPFTVDGVDHDTGIKLFSSDYAGIPAGVPGTASGIPSLETNSSGPYPVSGTPFEIQIVNVVAGLDTINPLPGLTVDTSNPGQATVAFTTTAGPTDPPRHLSVLNTRTGDLKDSASSVPINAQAGDTLVVMMSREPVDPRSDLSVVFNEPIQVDTTLAPADLDAALQQLFKLEQNNTTTNTWSEVAATTFNVDSGYRRVRIHANLQAGLEYRLRLMKDITDTGSPALKLAQVGSGVPANEIDLYFVVRKPKGDFTLTNDKISAGQVRDLALDGNLLLVSAQEGGIFAYDASKAPELDPAAPFAHADAIPAGTGQSWSIFVDHHGRIWNTAVTGLFGVVRTYRTEKFAEKLQPGANTDAVEFYGGGTVSWRTGVTVGADTGLDVTILSDRPEATPRKMQIAVQDEAVQAIVDGNVLANLGAAPLSANVTSTAGPGEFSTYTIKVRTQGFDTTNQTGFPYLTQRITVRNVTLGLRWSQDGNAGAKTGPAGEELTFDSVLARPGDTVRIERNVATYGVIALFGYGVGIYDLNALESNSRFAQNPSNIYEHVTYNKLGTLIGLTQGFPLANGAQALTFSPDVVMTADTTTDPSTLQTTATLTGFGLIPAKGMESVTSSHSSGTPEANGEEGATPGSISDFTDAAQFPDLNVIKTMVTNAKGSFWGRFNSVARYDVGATTYALVSGGQYGIVVVDITSGFPQLADVIWVPTGAWAVRTIGKQWATAIDGDGRALLIDLTHLDERSLPKASPCAAGAACAYPQLFPSLAAALRGGSGSGQYAFGSDDPRITWRGEPSGMNTTLAPVADPDTGFVFQGTLLQQVLHVMSGIDPHVAFKVNLGKGTLSEVSSIIPLGVPLPKTIADDRDTKTPCSTGGADVTQPTPCKENISLGAFRVEMTLPGAVLDALGGNLNIAIESERIAGALTEQTQRPMPAAHLRRNRPSGSLPETNPHTIGMLRVLPPSLATQYRLQKGYNLFISPWILALADPRASRNYDWGSNDREDAGCMACTIPSFLGPQSGKQVDIDFFEIYTNGRYVTVRPDRVSGGGSIFASAGNYAYLGDRNRVFARTGTVMADTVRPPKALVAANAPPVATGQILDTIYLHSGEVESSSVDFDAGGRAGWNVVFDRTYRSRTVGETPFGFGWDSGIFKRLRALPTGDVEYRDGSGEVWLYHLNGTLYETPLGYTQKLIHTERGWTLIDQKRRVTFFDELGRVTMETDEFFTPDGKGNVIRYIYDENGRLSAVIDPNDRKNDITYWTDAAHEGFVQQIKDWHQSQRIIKYTFDTKNRLTDVEMPTVATSDGTIAPKRSYTWSNGGSYNDDIELSTNLKAVKEPHENATSGPDRVTYEYTSPLRDAVSKQTWGTGESATFTIDGTTATTTDALGQVRTYTFHFPTPPTASEPKTTWYTKARAHIHTMTEQGVEVWTGAPYGQLPGSAPRPNDVNSVANQDRTYTYDYNDPDDTLKSETLTAAGTTAWTKSYGYDSPGAQLGKAVNCTATGTADICNGTGGAGAQDVVMRITHRASSAFVDAISANGLEIKQKEPERNTLTLAATTVTNSAVVSGTDYDPQTGLATTITTSGGTASSAACGGPCAGSKTTIHVPAPSPSLEKHKRGLPDYIDEGTATVLRTKFEYPPDENTTKVTDARGVATETTYDSWRRPTHVQTTGGGTPAQTLIEEYEYDASGRLHESRRQQAGQQGMAKTTYTYDAIGRVKQVDTNNVAVGPNNSTTITDSTDYTTWRNGFVTDHPAGGATTVTTIDKLGRTKSTNVTTNSSDIKSETRYDVAGNPAFITDTSKFAIASAYDTSGRRTDMMFTDGTRRHTDYDGWSRPKTVEQRKTNNAPVLTRTTNLEPNGIVRDVSESGEGGTLTSTFSWDGAGRTVGSDTSGASKPQALIQRFDDAGRIRTRQTGEGTKDSIPTVFMEANWQGYSHYLAPEVQTKEPHVTPSQPAGSYTTSLTYDTSGNSTQVATGGLTWNQTYDEAGNLKTAQAPARPQQTIDHDARGAVTKETLPDAATQSHAYDATGAKTGFTDPTNEPTTTTTDFIGRPMIIKYKDNTTQEIHYDGLRVLAMKDRQDRWQSFEYNADGHLVGIYASQTPGTASDRTDKIGYDEAGRLKTWTNRDSQIVYDDFTKDGLPRSTTQTRYRNHSGLTGSPDQIDTFALTHGYNAAGERKTMTLPGGGNGFASSVSYDYDAAGNLTSLTSDAGLSMAGFYRGSGRPNTRTITLPGGKMLIRKYDYKTDTGQLSAMTASVKDASGNEIVVGGSSVNYFGLQVSEAQLLGVSSGTRVTRYSYDMRNRLAGSVTATTGNVQAPPPGSGPSGPGTAAEKLNPADFRDEQQRAPVLDPATRTLLQSRHVDTAAIDPPGQTATQTPDGGHKIGTFTHGSATRTFDYAGKSERVDDGEFRYGYDEKGRLIWVAEEPAATGVTIRRIEYAYDGNNRLVGRTAQSAPVPTAGTLPAESDWQTETRQNVIAADGLPAETTFVWDPIADRLVSVMRVSDHGILKQILHGDMGYDDPVEVTTYDPAAPTPTVTKLYPIYDEAAAGSLQLVVNKDGVVVARSVNNDPFGSAEFDLAGAGIDNVTVTAKKDISGNLQSVNVAMRATEQLAPATVAGGARLAIVDSNGGTLRTFSGAPALDPTDGFTIRWTLSAGEWTALIDPTGTPRPPVSLSIAATSTLRAAVWSLDAPVLPAPDWVTASKPVFTSSTLPVEVRESLSNINSLIGSLQPSQSSTMTSYDIPNLGMLGSSGPNAETEGLLAATFQAQPFAEPFSRKFYVRERWYDPLTGTWLTPDPIGYRDSSNLYSFAGGDPINGRDPAGMADQKDKGIVRGVVTAVVNRAKGAARCLGLFENYAWYQLTGSHDSAGAASAYKWECVYPAVDAINAGPVQTIGGGAEKHRVAILKAYRSGNKGETAREATDAVLSLGSLVATVDGMANGTTPTAGPALATADGVVIPAAAVPSIPLAAPMLMTSNGGGGNARGVALDNAGGEEMAELDEVDLGQEVIIEEKNATGLKKANKAGRTPQTVAQWAQKHIVDKTIVKIKALTETASRTRPTKNGTPAVPSLSEIKDIRHIHFRVTSTDAEVISAVNVAVSKLSEMYDDWKFTVSFGGK